MQSIITGPRVLIVEDEALVGRELKASLQEMGCRVCALVASGEEALAELRQNQADVVIMDIVLRGRMDGIETAQAIRKGWGIPVVFLTAYADEGLRDLALMARPAALLYKPVTAARLLQTIGEALAPDDPHQPSLFPA